MSVAQKINNADFRGNTLGLIPSGTSMGIGQKWVVIFMGSDYIYCYLNLVIDSDLHPDCAGEIHLMLLHETNGGRLFLQNY